HSSNASSTALMPAAILPPPPKRDYSAARSHLERCRESKAVRLLSARPFGSDPARDGRPPLLAGFRGAGAGQAAMGRASDRRASDSSSSPSLAAREPGDRRAGADRSDTGAELSLRPAGREIAHSLGADRYRRLRRSRPGLA